MGTNFDLAAVDQLRPGMSRAEVIARLGEPNARSILADGSESLMWLHSKANAFGTAQAKSVSLLFDSSGALVRPLTTSFTKMN